MNKSVFNNMTIIWADRLFEHEQYVSEKVNSTTNAIFSNNSDVMSDRKIREDSDKALEIKKAKVYYSINLLLNESSKLLVLAVLAILLHVFVKYVFCLISIIVTCFMLDNKDEFMGKGPFDKLANRLVDKLFTLNNDVELNNESTKEMFIVNNVQGLKLYAHDKLRWKP